MEADAMRGEQSLPDPVVLTGSLSRRTLLRRLQGGGLAAAGLALAPGLVAAQASPMASPGAIPPRLQEWAAALSSDDAARAAALFTDDALLEDLAFGLRFRGKAQIQAGLAGIFKVVPDFKLHATAGFLAGDMAAAEWVFSGTDRGLIPNAPATGKRFAVRGASVIELRGDHIRRESDYYDLLTILRQLGLMPGAGTPAAGTPAP
jgi:steroid delta-isomerase-like uncharacterized protein